METLPSMHEESDLYFIYATAPLVEADQFGKVHHTAFLAKVTISELHLERCILQLRRLNQGLGCAGAFKCTEVHLMQSNAVEYSRMQSNAARVAFIEVRVVYLDAELLF